MCGLVGFWGPPGQLERGALLERLAPMAAALRARGPDAEGTWVDAAAGLALGFRRLAVLDTSAAGNQPMVSADGQHVLVFNGEIYNADEVRARLEAQGLAPAWRGHADTEVLLAALVAWGLETTLDAVEGMFAFAWWRGRERRLVLARDRFGEKPLVYGWMGNTFLFGSQVSALRPFPAFDTRLAATALAELLALGWIGGDRCVYAALRKLPAGHWLEVGPDGSARSEPRRWWSAREAVQRARTSRTTGSFDEAVDEVEAALAASVAARIRADVPVGVLLSGGVDSSAVLLSMPESADVRTFTIGFAEAAQDESPHARAVAQHLGRDATVLRTRPEDALALVPALAERFDEPFADSSQVPTALVAQLARQHVTVVLGGDGGDELFGGYAHHLAARRRFWWWRQALADRRAGWGAAASSAVRVQRNVHAAWRRLPLSRDVAALARPVPGPAEAPPAGLSRGRTLQWLDAITYLPDDLLVKVDRATMGVGLEARSPFLAPGVFDAAWRLPDGHLVEGTRGKRVVRALLRRRLPTELVDRPKQGFSIPLDAWLRGPLAAWARGLLDPQRLRGQGLLDVAAVEATWQGHASGERPAGRRLWAVLMLQAWLASSSGPGGTPECAA
ncbi:MAG: asparagine synthase (glutamine-hydrolyzing) [Planctomycetota bacterium]